jgi:AraC-like DNA-binding protein
MKYKEYQPARPLRTVINCFWSIEQDPEDLPSGSWDRTVPDGSLELVLHLADPMIRKPLHGEAAPESRCILIGQMTEPYLVGANGPARMLGVRFFPHTGYRFLDGPVAGFNDRSVDLDSILPRGARLPLERIGDTGRTRGAIRILEGWCMDRLHVHSLSTRDRYFSFACRTILHGRGAIAIGDLSRQLGISNRYLERLFLDRGGISPKLFARIIRFQHALGFLSSREPPGLAAIAQEAGYFDQSHFVREFRRFAGVAPREFAREQHPYTGHFADPANSSYLYNFR